MAGVGDALTAAHFPNDANKADAARGRLAFEELFLHQAALASPQQHDAARRAPSLDPQRADTDVDRVAAVQLTRDQARAVEEIDADLVGERPMQRLLMGKSARERPCALCTRCCALSRRPPGGADGPDGDACGTALPDAGASAGGGGAAVGGADYQVDLGGAPAREGARPPRERYRTGGSRTR